MANIQLDSTLPTGLFIVRDDRVQVCVMDWDYPGVASRMGWVPCDCGSTDGTVDCQFCGRTVEAMIPEARKWIDDREGEDFPALNDYLPQPMTG